jgi:hypothetical protein
MLYHFAYGQSLQPVRRLDIATLSGIHLTRLVRDRLSSSALVLHFECCNPHVEAYVATTVNITSDLTSGRIMHGAEMSCNVRVSKASKHAMVGVTFYGWDFRSKSAKGAVRSQKE